MVKKESTTALVRKQQARQQASLASVYERDLALAKAATKKEQENSEKAEMLCHLADEVAELTKIYNPIKGRAGTVHLPLALKQQRHQCDYLALKAWASQAL